MRKSSAGCGGPGNGGEKGPVWDNIEIFDFEDAGGGYGCKEGDVCI